MSDTILTDKTLKSSKDKNEKEKGKEMENGNENNKTLMSSKDDDDDDDENENENEDDDDTMSQNEKNKIIKGKKWCFRWNNWQIKIFEEQIKSLKKLENLKAFWPCNDYGGK